jgi:PAS domain S-box-containing protein
MGLMLLSLTALHLYTDPSMQALHLLYRRLYYVPILYAAFVFGLRGGLLTGVASALLLLPSVLGGAGHLGVADGVNEMAMYLLIGGLFGWMREVEDKNTSDLRRIGRQLEEAYLRLEERTFELLTIQEYTSAILQSITAGVVTIGPDGSITTANPAAERLFGVGEEDMVPHTLSVLLGDEDGLGREISRVLDGRVPRSAKEVTLRTRTGRTVHAHATMARMQDHDGHTLGAVVTLEDMSEVKSLTDQLIRADRLAALGELTAGVAHEVRNPLGIIRASVQLLEEQRHDPSKAIEAGDIIMQEVDRLDRVVKELLDFGRPWSPALVRVNMNLLLEEVVLFTQKWASRGDVELRVDYGRGVPEIMADPHQLKQVFVNLISNAVQVMESGGTLEIETASEDGYVSVRFSDDGPGMDPETQNKVFDPFYSTRADGTGLGLTIVHRIIDEHDGHVELTSAPGGGTTFKVYLPVRQSFAPTKASGEADSARAASEQ